MKVVKISTLPEDRIVKCPNNGFISNRILLESDNMGYTLTKTIIPKGTLQFWHYKNHLESCYCIKGIGILTDKTTNKEYKIVPDCIYILDKNDPHVFQALTEVILICVFNPPLKGKEVHNKDGSYD